LPLILRLLQSDVRKKKEGKLGRWSDIKKKEKKKGKEEVKKSSHYLPDITPDLKPKEKEKKEGETSLAAFWEKKEGDGRIFLSLLPNELREGGKKEKGRACRLGERGGGRGREHSDFYIFISAAAEEKKKYRRAEFGRKSSFPFRMNAEKRGEGRSPPETKKERALIFIYSSSAFRSSKKGGGLLPRKREEGRCSNPREKRKRR